MTPELYSLTASAVLCALLFVPYGIAQLKYWGVRTSVGNRINVPELPFWAQRAKKAHYNLIENLTHFSVLIVVANLVGVESSLTIIGANVFLWARILHAVVYLLGIPWLRTIAFFAGLSGEILIVAAILQH